MKQLALVALLLAALFIVSCGEATQSVPSAAVSEADGITVLISCCDGRADQIWPLDPSNSGPVRLGNTQVRVFRRIASAVPFDFLMWIQEVEREAGLSVRTIILSTHGEAQGVLCVSSCGGQIGLREMFANPTGPVAAHLPPEVRNWLPLNIINSDAYDQLALEFRTVSKMRPGIEVLGEFWAHNAQSPVALFYKSVDGQMVSVPRMEWETAQKVGAAAGTNEKFPLGTPSQAVQDYFSKVMANNPKTAAIAAQLKFAETQGFKKVVLNGTKGVPLPEIAPNFFKGADAAFEVTLRIGLEKDAVAQASYALPNLIKSGGDLVIVLPKNAPPEILPNVLKELNVSQTFRAILGSHEWTGTVELIIWDGRVGSSPIMLRAPSQALEQLVYTPRSAAPPAAPTPMPFWQESKPTQLNGEKVHRWLENEPLVAVVGEDGKKLRLARMADIRNPPLVTEYIWRGYSQVELTQMRDAWTAMSSITGMDMKNIHIAGNELIIKVNFGETVLARALRMGYEGFPATLQLRLEGGIEIYLAMYDRGFVHVNPSIFRVVKFEGTFTQLNDMEGFQRIAVSPLSKMNRADYEAMVRSAFKTQYANWIRVHQAEIEAAGAAVAVAKPGVVPTPMTQTQERVVYRVMPEFVVVGSQRITLQKFDPAMMKFGWTGTGTKEIAIQLEATGHTHLLGIPKEWGIERVSPQLLAELGAPMPNPTVSGRILKYLGSFVKGTLVGAGYVGTGWMFMTASNEMFGWGPEVAVTGAQPLSKNPSEDKDVLAALDRAQLIASPIFRQLNGGSHDGVLSLFRRRQNRPYPLMMANTSHIRLLTVSGFLPDDIATNIIVYVRDDLGSGRPTLVYVNQVSGEIVEWRFDAVFGAPKWTQWVVDEKDVGVYRPDGGKCMAFSAMIPGWDPEKQHSTFYNGQFELCWPNGVQRITPMPINKF